MLVMGTDSVSSVRISNALKSCVSSLPQTDLPFFVLFAFFLRGRGSEASTED